MTTNEATPTVATAAEPLEEGAAPTAPGSHVLHLPSPRAFVRHALPNLLEGTIGPAVVFYLVLLASGFRGAVIAALVWSFLALLRRLVRRERVSGLLALGLVLLILRTIVSFLTGSAFLYFMQPSLGTFLVAVLFLGSVIAGRPLAERLAHDFCPLDAGVVSRAPVRKFFMRISLLWCVVLSVNAGFVLWLLVSTSLKAFVLERTIASTAITAGGVALSVMWFLRVMREEGVPVRWGGEASLAPVEVRAD